MPMHSGTQGKHFMDVDPSIDKLDREELNLLRKLSEYFKANAKFAESEDVKRQAKNTEDLQATLDTKRPKTAFASEG